MKAGFLEKLIDRIPLLQASDVQGYLEDLAREKGFLETIFNALEEGIVVTDLKSRILYLNRSACEMFALVPEIAVGKKLSDQVKGLDWSCLTDTSNAVAREMEIFYPKNLFVSFYVSPLMSDNGLDLVGRAIILRDVTESRRATEETIESERFSALTLLAAGVAHEIGNPLNSLSIHLSLLERRLGKIPEKSRKELTNSVRIAKEEVNRLDHIITQFLRAIRPTPLQTALEPLNEVVEQSVEFFRPELRNRDVIVEMELGGRVPSVPMDRDQIKQALYNVIRNSLQAMKTGGILHVRTGADEGHVWVGFSDTGGGIAPDDMSRVFEPYFTTKPGGSGLGLLIVRRIVREHGGEVMMESAPSRGLTVTIRLPRHDLRARFLPPHSDAPGA